MSTPPAEPAPGANGSNGSSGPAQPAAPAGKTGRTTGPRDPVSSGIAPAASSNSTQRAIPPEALAQTEAKPAAQPAAQPAAPSIPAAATPAAPASAPPGTIRKGTTRTGSGIKTNRQRRITGKYTEVATAPPKPMSGGTKLLVGGVALATVLMVALMLNLMLQSGPAPAPQQKPPPAGIVTGTGTEPGNNAPVPGTAQTPAGPEAPAEPLTDRQKLVADYDAYAKEHPADFLGRRERLDTLMTIFDDNDWTSCIELRLDRLKKYADRVAEERVSTVIQKSNACAQNGDFAGAFEAIDSFPNSLSRTAAAFQLNFQRKKIGELVQAAVHTAEATAQERCEAGQYDEALKAYDKLLASKYPPVMQDVRIRINEIKDTKKRGRRPGEDPAPQFSGTRQFYSADTYAGLAAAVEVFDDECQEAIHGYAKDSEAVREKLREYPRSAVLYFCLSMIETRGGDRLKAEWALAQARRLADKNNPRFESRALGAEARMCMSQLQLEEAKDKAVAALRADAENPDAHFTLGQCLYIEYAQMRAVVGGKEAAEAIAADMIRNFKAAITLDPSYIRVVPPRLRGIGSLDTNDAGEAEEEDPYKYKGDGGNPLLASIVVIYRESELGVSIGTGFVVQSSKGKAIVVTNHHVVGDANKFRIKYRVATLDSVAIKETTEAKVLIRDEAHDLAVMEITTINEIKALPLRGTLTGLQCPQKVTVIGHPQGLEFTVIIAQLSNLNRQENHQRYLQLDGSVDHGMSGGPIVDQDGNVIAVVMAKYDAKGQGLGILSEHVRDICKKVKIELTLK